MEDEARSLFVGNVRRQKKEINSQHYCAARCPYKWKSTACRNPYRKYPYGFGMEKIYVGARQKKNILEKEASEKLLSLGSLRSRTPQVFF